MTKRVMISESAYERLKEGKIDEISYGKVDDAYDRLGDIFFNVSNAFDEFESAVDEAISNVRFDSKEGQSRTNPYLSEIKSYCDKISTIIERKKRQEKLFYDETMNKFSHEDFRKGPDAEDNYYGDMELRYLQDKYPGKRR